MPREHWGRNTEWPRGDIRYSTGKLLRACHVGVTASTVQLCRAFLGLSKRSYTTSKGSAHSEGEFAIWVGKKAFGCTICAPLRLPTSGGICIGCRKINLSRMFAGQKVGGKEIGEKVWLVTFMHYDIGSFDQEFGRVDCAENPFGAEVSPTGSKKQSGVVLRALENS
jgi:hypothetical protein